jgi:hypothetical protein
MKYAVKNASCGMIFVPSFMKIGTGVQVILRFNPRNLIDLITPLRWVQVP